MIIKSFKIINNILLMIIIIIIQFSLSGCKKEYKTEFRTIYPLPYLPVYPGSYWKYRLEGHGDTAVMATSDNYELFGCRSTDLNGQLIDSVYVPFFKTSTPNYYFINWQDLPIIGYSTFIKDNSKWESYTAVKILSTELINPWIYNTDNDCQRKVVSVNSTENINNTNYSNVIIIEDCCEWSQTIGGVTDRYYYAENVGLIKYCKCIYVYTGNGSGYQSNYAWDLYDYHINN